MQVPPIVQTMLMKFPRLLFDIVALLMFKILVLIPAFYVLLRRISTLFWGVRNVLAHRHMHSVASAAAISYQPSEIAI